jgi:rSAM/selenodomain-associated transferase 2
VAVNELAIVIPVLNDADALRVLLSDLAVHACGAEVVVVDGGSDDESAAIACAAGVTVLTVPRGRARQLRAGIARTTRPWIWMLHADSGVDGEAVAALSRVVACGVPAWGRFDVRLSGSRAVFRCIETLMNLRSRLSGIATGDQGIFVHRSLLDAIGGVPEQALMEDIELTWRLKRIEAPRNLSARLRTSSRRWESRGVARTVLLMWRLRLGYRLGADPAALARRYDGH